MLAAFALVILLGVGGMVSLYSLSLGGQPEIASRLQNSSPMGVSTELAACCHTDCRQSSKACQQ